MGRQPIGPRCHELRITDGKSDWRILYRIDPDAIVVLEVFQKQVEQTPKWIIENCRRRLRQYDELSGMNGMDKTKGKRLEAAGWRVGTVREFLDLSAEEAAYVELKLQLARNLRRRRRGKKLTQIQLAKMLRSSQSRVAKMEAGDPTVSVDLLVRSLLALGASPKCLLRALPQ